MQVKPGTYANARNAGGQKSYSVPGITTQERQILVLTVSISFSFLDIYVSLQSGCGKSRCDRASLVDMGAIDQISTLTLGTAREVSIQLH